MKITESQLKNATSTFYECEQVDGLASIREAIESLGIEVIPDPKTITINGVKVPAPERVAPEVGTVYYAIEIFGRDQYIELPWNADSVDFRTLERGLLHLNKENCLAAANALLNALKEQP
jgi:hypothetical protein